jgi:hypothetical protein
MISKSLFKGLVRGISMAIGTLLFGLGCALIAPCTPPHVDGDRNIPTRQRDLAELIAADANGGPSTIKPRSLRALIVR